MASRHESKEKQRMSWEARQQYERDHPVLSGRVKVEDYHEPHWVYVRPQPVRNPIPIPVQVLG